jgi:hypothetical protein
VTALAERAGHRGHVDLAALAAGQDNRCFYCDRAMSRDARRPDHATRDHKRPTSRGGRSAAENVAAACFRCNQLKGDLTAAEFRAQVARDGGWGALPEAAPPAPEGGDTVTAAAPAPLAEGALDLLRSLASGGFDAAIAHLQEEVKAMETPEQQRLLLGKIQAQLEKAIELRHNGHGFRKAVHDAAGALQSALGGKDPARELNLRLAEAIRDLARLRDRVLARRWDEDAENKRLAELRAAGDDAIERLRARRDAGVTKAGGE